ncbi:thiaminase II [Candidatus Bathyarchaeota archaeon]|nr:thiaminase II [Candidatus Bathyarchaeota archaeon]
MKFSDELKQENIELWKTVLRHPFIKELGEGTLPMDKFTYYIKQDYLYLEEFARCIGLAASKAGNIDSMRAWAEKMAGCLRYETEMLEDLSAKLNLPKEEISDAEFSPTNRAYTNQLLKVAYSGTIGENIAALLPCMWTYQDVGEVVKHITQVHIHPLYEEWCQAYSAPEYVNLVKTYIDSLNSYASRAGDSQKDLMKKHFALSLKYEFMFWEMSYNMEKWPL